MKNEVTISEDDDGQGAIQLRISQKSFSDLVFSLAKTPSEERRKKRYGFDLSKGDLRTLVDKISHHVETQNTLINFSFSSSIALSNGDELSTHEYQQFFEVVDNRNDTIESLALTLSFTLAFSRGLDDRSIEKQTIALLIHPGDYGTLEISIRSTELTWPTAIFRIIEHEFDTFQRRKRARLGVRESRFFFYSKDVYEVFSNNTLNGVFKTIQFTGLSIVTMFVIMIVLLIAQWSFKNDSPEQNLPPEKPDPVIARIYDKERKVIVEHEFYTISGKLGWEETARLHDLTAKLPRKIPVDRLIKPEEDTETSPGFWEAQQARLNASWNLMTKAVGFFAFFFIISNFEIGRRITAAESGYLGLFDGDRPISPPPDIIAPAIASIIGGICSSVVASAIIYLFVI